jgi:phytoene synthase
MAAPDLPPYAVLVRRHDPDRFFTALFAPPAMRDTLFVLYAFNHELARAREVASEPTLALIRLQWWREVVEGDARRHELATPLAEAIAGGRLRAADLLTMIEAREVEAEFSMPTLEALLDYLEGTAGTLAMAAGRALGAGDAVLPRLRALGTAYGVAGQIRSVAALARQGRCLLPEDLLAAHGLSIDAVIAAPRAPELGPVLSALAAEGLRRYAAGRGHFSRDVIAAALPGVLARRDLRRPATAVGRGRTILDQARVMAAVALARI